MSTDERGVQSQPFDANGGGTAIESASMYENISVFVCDTNLERQLVVPEMTDKDRYSTAWNNMTSAGKPGSSPLSRSSITTDRQRQSRAGSLSPSTPREWSRSPSLRSENTSETSRSVPAAQLQRELLNMPSTSSRFLRLPRQRALSDTDAPHSLSLSDKRAASTDSCSPSRLTDSRSDTHGSTFKSRSSENVLKQNSDKVLRRQKTNVQQADGSHEKKTLRQQSCPTRPTSGGPERRIVKAKSESARSPKRFSVADFLSRKHHSNVDEEDVPLNNKPFEGVESWAEPKLKMDGGFKSKAGAADMVDCAMVTVLQPAQMLDSEIILHEAARKNSIQQVRQLIAEKVDVNSRNNLDRTALHWAAAGGNTKVTETLLSAGADIEAQDKYGMKAVLWAAWFGHKDTVQFLVNSGANTRSTNKQGMHLLHCASHNNHADVVAFIADSLETYNIDDIEKNGKTSLHLASENGHVETVEKLLKMKANIAIKDKIGQTPLHLASANGHDNVVKLLIQGGVEIDDRDQDGRTCLYLAAENGHATCASTLLTATADPNAESVKEMTPLQASAANGYTDVVQTLLEFGCNVNSLNHQCNTALHLAAVGDHAEVVAIIAQHGAELNIPNKRMLTPLHVAVENGLANVVEALLIAGADIHIKEKAGKTALNMAARGNYVTIVDMIIKADRIEDIKRSPTNGSESASCNEDYSHGQLPEESDEKLQFKKSNNRYATQMKDILFKLAHQQLKTGEWKKLASYWNFTDDHIKAIEHQHTGEYSFREHGYRMMMIWMHGFKKQDNPMKHLFEGLVAIGKRSLAESIRKKANLLAQGSEAQGSCVIS